MDGWVVIGTKLDTKQLEADLKNAKKELTQFQKEEERLLKEKGKIELSLSAYDDEKAKIKANTDEMLKKAETEGQVTNLLNMENMELDKLTQKYSKQFSSLDEINGKLKNNQVQQGLVNNKIEEANKKLSQAKGYKNVEEQIGKISDKTSNVVKQVGRWALAIFSVRSAYSFLSRASSTLAQYNKEYGANLEYIRFALAQAIAPVLQFLVDLAYKLLVYINYIAQEWFGVNLFSNASSKNFQKMAGSAEKIKKSLQATPFDEMDILNDNSSSGGGAGTVVPSFDLSQMDIQIPSWIKWITKNKDLILNFFKTLGVVIATLKIGVFILNLFKMIGAFKTLSGLQMIAFFSGIAIAIVGIISTIKSIINYIKDPSWTNFNKILSDLSITILGVALAMVVLTGASPIGMITLIIGAVVGLIAVLSNLANKFFSNQAQILSTKKAKEELKKATEALTKATDDYVNAVDNAEEAQKNLEEVERKNKISGEQLYQAVKNGTLDYKNMTDAQKEVYKAYLNNENAQEQLQVSTENLTEAKKNERKASLENQLTIAKESKNYNEFKDTIVDAYEKGELSAKEARDYIERAMAGMSNASKQTFQEDLPNDIKQGLNPDNYESIWTKFKNKWNEFWSGLKTKLHMDVSANYSGNSGKSNVSGFAKGGIVYHNLPRLASGGIINQPGRGVPIASAIGGESGREGVIPLTDSQAMETLGETIGRYITINANITNSMNGRIISRELQRIRGNQDFAYNK